MTRKNSLDTMRYRPDIDGLRAIAVLAVVFFHAFPKAIPGGFIGVDIFFVISGYLISSIIFRDISQNQFSFLDFYVRRINRIFPSLAIVLFFCIGLGWLTLLPNEFAPLGQHITWGAGFMSNILLWREIGYFDRSSELKPLLHLWSLGIEEQFYIFWPLIIWLLSKLRGKIFAIINFLALLSFSVCLYDTYTKDPASFYSPQARFWELLAGGSLAYLQLFRKPTGKYSNLKSCGGTALIFIGLFSISGKSAFPGLWALLPVVGTLAIISSGQNSFLNRHIFSQRIAVGIGLISYPFYLWHWPLLSFSRIILGFDPTPQTKVAILAVSFVLAGATYVFFEKPIRFYFKSRFKPALLTFILFVLGLSNFIIPKIDNALTRKIVTLNPSFYSGSDGGAEGNIEFGCGISNPKNDHDFATCFHDKREEAVYAVIGDSKADSLYSGLVRTSLRGARWEILGGNGRYAAPVPVMSENPLFSKYQHLIGLAVETVKQQPQIRVVLIVAAARNLFQLEDGLLTDDLPDSPNYQVALEGVTKTVTELVHAGKKVVLLIDNPTLPSPEDCLSRETAIPLLNKLKKNATNPRCTLKITQHLSTTRRYRELLGEIKKTAPDKIEIFDSTTYMCDLEQGICPRELHGRILYSYSDHISDFSSGRIGSGINEFLKKSSF